MITAPTGDKPTKIQISDQIVGTGAKPVYGDQVSVHYVAVSLESGGELRSTWSATAHE